MRGSSMAQVILSIATILGFWFTVIPLYQKAALDEQMAKREIELKAAQESIVSAKREAYEQHRLNYSSRFAVLAADRCSDVRRGFPKELERVSPDARHAALLTLDVDVGKCLTGAAAESHASNVLTPVDQAYLAKVLSDLSATYDPMRSKAARDINDLPLRASFDKASLDPPGEFTQKAERFQDEVAAKLHVSLTEGQLAARQRNAIERTQERFASDFRQACFNGVLNALRNIKWPASVPASVSTVP
jgi:hypothetical protein